MSAEAVCQRSYLTWIRNSHQSSTYLVSVLCAPLVVLGVPPAWAFVVWSCVASACLVLLLWRLCREVFPDRIDLAAVAVMLFLVHPATSRCFARPQTDGLMALFAFATVVIGRHVTLRSRGLRWLSALLCLAVFVKIHALSLLLLAPAVAFLHGARGRDLMRVIGAGCVVPALFWALVFGALGVFPTIAQAWDYKGQFYRQITVGIVLQVVAMCLLPLLLVAVRRLRGRGVDGAMWLTLVGFSMILVISSIPPKARFQYPLLAPLVFLAVAALDRRPAVRGSRLLVTLLVGWFSLLSFAILVLDLYGRYLGPTRDLAPVDAIMIHLF